MKTYILKENGSRKIGDKIEYFFDLQEEKNGPREVMNLIKEVLSKKDITVKQILDIPDRFDKLISYEKIRKEACFTASQKQVHVLSFIERLLQDIALHEYSE